ncbi:NUDIX hydrolase domain-like protein [Radiomyces spectabilis]|uniref:NUDIX hydrolase domain-like protein n=1 Tax=Radiomyces spectabilis TaxID=64574 RepID=UPI00222014AB|nr:NUDIX hydrolase domain-like protein [Radiomyces spectabilis]KAI8365230.1 NUDIX hydrolase domain-like protein [Radiomyces spectabilis]
MRALHSDSSGDIYRSVASIILKRPPLATESHQDDDDVHRPTRLPKSTLYMIVKKPRKHNAWQFPQGGVEPGETIAEAALRELAEECGSAIKVQLLDKTAAGVYQYRFPKAFIENRPYVDPSVGAKVEFIRANWVSGQCQPDQNEIVDFAWLTRKELSQYITKEYEAALASLLDNDV